MPGLFNSPTRLSPNKSGRSIAPGPQRGKLQLLHGGRGHLEDDLAGMPDNLGRHIDDPTSHRGGISFHGRNVPANILFERFEEEKGHQHGVIEGRIGRKTQKRQFFKAEIFR